MEPASAEPSTTSGDLNLPKSVTVLQNNGALYYLIGTAHVSAKSVQDVEEVIAKVQPDTIVVELCEARYEAMSNPDRWKKMDVIKVVREGRGMLLMANIMLSAFQRRIGDKIGVKPGAEMMRAVELAQQHQARMILGDRNVQVTLKRTWGGLGVWEKMKLMSTLLVSTLGGDEEVSESDLEKLKEGDVLSEVLAEVGKAYPAVKARLIDERDLWLMDSVYSAPGQKVVAVVGAGHVPGMVAHWGEKIDKIQLSETPQAKNIWLNLFKWGVPSLIVLSFVYAFAKGNVGWDAVGIWCLASGSMAGLGALCALGHPLSILSAIVAAPYTTLNPLVAAGMVSGTVEALLRKPKVSDCESLAEDTLSLKGWYKNRITRVLLVFGLTNLGAALGTYLGVFGIFKVIGSP